MGLSMSFWCVERRCTLPLENGRRTQKTVVAILLNAVVRISARVTFLLKIRSC